MSSNPRFDGPGTGPVPADPRSGDNRPPSMWNGVKTIYLKELVDTTRDRKTLWFMLLIPTLMVPLLMGGMSRLTQGIQREAQLRELRVAATPETRAAYLALAHQWFLDTAAGRGMRLANTPLFRALVPEERRAELPDVPSDVFRDPEAFRAWTLTLVDKVRKDIDNLDKAKQRDDERRGLELKDGLPAEVLDEAFDFNSVAVKGVGLVTFVDVSELPPAPPDFDLLSLPAPLREIPEVGRIVAGIRSRQIHAYLDIPPEALELRAKPASKAVLRAVADSSIDLSREALERIEEVVAVLKRSVADARVRAAKLPPQTLKPIELAPARDIATRSDVTMVLIGGMLPFFAIFFTFLGGMYPAIDLGAGEKERNTLETLILAPVSRLEIALGKFAVILTTSLVSTFLGLVSLLVTFRWVMPPGLVQMLDMDFDPALGLLVAALAIPLAAAFSGAFLAISILARSFKEAQNYLAPMQFLIILPGMAGMVPGVEMKTVHALIPIVNVSLLFKQFLIGNIRWDYYWISFASCAALAAVCVGYAVRQFRDESVLFRT